MDLTRMIHRQLSSAELGNKKKDRTNDASSIKPVKPIAKTESRSPNNYLHNEP